VVAAVTVAVGSESEVVVMAPAYTPLQETEMRPLPL